MEFETVVLTREELESLDVAIAAERFDGLEQGSLWQQAYEIVADSRVLNENRLHAASRFVFGMDEDVVASFGSISTGTYGPDGDGVEFYQMIVHPDYRGQGCGRETFEQRVDTAEQVADEYGRDVCYTEVLNVPTDAYTRINEAYETTGYQDLLDAAADEGLAAEEVFRRNPMHDLVVDYGFEPYQDTAWKTAYKAAVDDLVESCSAPVSRTQAAMETQVT